MFDVGFWELAIIAVIALLVIGPERLPKAARTVGLWIGRARRIVSDVKADIDREIRESDLAELKKAGEELKKTQNTFESVGEELIEGSELEDLKNTAKELNAAKGEFESAGADLRDSIDSNAVVESRTDSAPTPVTNPTENNTSR